MDLRRTRIWASAGALAVLSLAGCQQYNGAWGFGRKPEPVPAGSTDQAMTPPAAAQGEMRQGMDGGKMQAGERTAAGPVVGPQFIGADNSAAAGAGGQSVRPLALFGDLPKAVAGKSSAMDGADNVRRVTFASEGADFDPEVDPTGTLLVYASTQHRKTADIYIKRIDGTAVTQLTNDPAEDIMPTFSPDGSKIAFCSNRSGSWNIYMMDASGGQPVQITSDTNDSIHPSFSADGKRLVYCSYSAQAGQWEMVMVDLDHPGTKKFLGNGLFPRWSPKGDQIVFQRARERGTHWFSIWTIDLVNGEAMRPTEIVASTNAAAITPRWSPDGRGIVFCTVIDPTADMNKSPSQADVWVVNADGTGRANLTQSPFANLQPVWAKDGAIYFGSNRGVGGVENIWSLRPDRAVRVARNESSPDGAPPRQGMTDQASKPPMMTDPAPAPAGKTVMEDPKAAPVSPTTRPAGSSSAAVEPSSE